MSGPYIITTWTEDVSAAAHAEGYTQEVRHRRAVATLEEAREAVWQHVYDAERADEHEPFFAAIKALPESGGTVGPLPDGTVIEVHRVVLEELANEADLNIDPDNYGLPVATEADIIDAYNAKEAKS